MKRLFLVGCPRSGTTLLQSLIAAHSQVISFPETHLFSKTIHIHPLVQFFTVYGEKQIKESIDIAKTFELQLPRSFFKKKYSSTQDWVKQQIAVLDEIAKKSADDVFFSYYLEKTPRHLHFIDQIHSVDPEAEFIHIIRNGEDVVASLSEAASNSPEHWSGSRDIKKSVFWWNRSIKLSEKYIGKEKHHFVWYSELVDHTKEIIEKLFLELDLDNPEDVMKKYQGTASELVLENEKWKAKNTSTEISHSDKFNDFPTKTQKLIKQNLHPFDFSRISINTDHN